MRIKDKVGDFRVRELLDESYLRARGPFRVYRVTKKKRTSMEAAAVLADMAGVGKAEVGLAGLKDRQGVTTQFMSAPRAHVVRLQTPDLKIEAVGFASEPLTSAHSFGNAFDVRLREMSTREIDRIEVELQTVREHGIPNYFGEQRFGNLRHGQGWIARDLVVGEHERALKSLLCAKSESDNERNRRFKGALTAQWGDWRSCREIAGKFGAHHSVFEHLTRRPEDYAGAFRYIGSRLRLIHLYAWQSHLWNRAVARYVESITPPAERLIVPSPEGRLYFARAAMAIDPSMNNGFRLPGPKLADVEHPRQRELLTEALQREGVGADAFNIEGVSGFQLKGEDRALVIHPRDLSLSRSGRDSMSLHFELPRGAYATLVVARLVAEEPESRRAPRRESKPRDKAPKRSPGRPGRPRPRARG
jgi:tRNA pseudouridine13 synthase